MLKEEPQAMLGVLQVIRRVQRASQKFTTGFARHELNIDEITLAARSVDLAEILLWCFAPKRLLEIRRLQQADKNLRSAAAQQQVPGLGFLIYNSCSQTPGTPPPSRR